jgi:ABC-type transport system involved in multi-copper enzyme maturation permease subunit
MGGAHVRLLGAELLKLRRRPASYVVLVVLVAVIGLFYVGLGASTGQVSDRADQIQLRLLLSYPNTYFVLVGMMLSFGGLLAVTYGASVSGAEWAWGTIRNVVARGESRPRYVNLKFVAVGLLIGVGIVVTFAFGAVMALFAAGLAGVSTSEAFSADTLKDVPQLLARTWLGVTEQAAIGFAIAMLFRSQLAGIGAGLALYFGEIFLALVPVLKDYLPYFPFSVAQAVVTSAPGLGVEGGGSAARLDTGAAAVLAGIYLGASLLVASVAAWRAEITA